MGALGGMRKTSFPYSANFSLEESLSRAGWGQIAAGIGFLQCLEKRISEGTCVGEV